MNLEIDNNDIEGSFDRIAKEIITQKALFVNEKVFRFTEIEFYYFYKDIHTDSCTHPHLRNEGEWRLHEQGFDITFKGTDIRDGGILIRGVLVDGEYINGPIKTLGAILQAFGKVTEKTSFIIKDAEPRDVKIIKTFRHNLNEKESPNFFGKHYRFLCDFNDLKIKKAEKVLINKNHSQLL